MKYIHHHPKSIITKLGSVRRQTKYAEARGGLRVLSVDRLEDKWKWFQKSLLEEVTYKWKGWVEVRGQWKDWTKNFFAESGKGRPGRKDSQMANTAILFQFPMMVAFPSILIAPITAYFLEKILQFSMFFSILGSSPEQLFSRLGESWRVVWGGLGLRWRRRKTNWIWLDEVWCSHVWTIVGISPIQPFFLVKPRMAWWGIWTGSEFLSGSQASVWPTTDLYQMSCALSLKCLFFWDFASSFQTWT